MDNKNKTYKIQNMFFVITLVLIGTGMLFFLLGYLNSQSENQLIPVAIIELSRGLLYYHALHFVVGIGILLYLIQKIKSGLKIKLVKTILSLALTPFSFVVMLAALLLIGLGSCTA